MENRSPAEGGQGSPRRQWRFRGLIEHAPDILAVLDSAGLYAYVSPSFTRLLGYEVDEVIGTNPLDSVHPDDAEATAAKLGMLARQPGMVISHRYRYRHRGGEWRVVESTGSNLLGDRDIAGIVINTRDVTEQVRAEEALRRSVRHREAERRPHPGRERARRRHRLPHLPAAGAEGVRGGAARGGAAGPPGEPRRTPRHG